MAFSNDGLQVQEYVYDFDVDGGVIGAIDLSAKDAKDPIPVGAIIKSVTAKVETAVVGSSSTLEWGNGDDADGYSGAAIAEASLTADALFNGWDNGAALLWDDTNDHALHVNVADSDDGKFEVSIGTGALTAGKVLFMVEYLMPAGV